MPRICRVLVVEAHEGVAALLGDALHDDGYRFTLVADGMAMRHELDRTAYDIVLVDLSLRGEDGFELAREAAEHGAGIILTSSEQRLVEAMRQSGHHYLTKPFMLDALLQMVRQVLRQTEARCRTRKGARAAVD